MTMRTDLIMSCILAAVLAATVSVRAAEAEAKTVSQAPDRLSRVRPGDWFRFFGNGHPVREICFHVEGEGAERKVHYLVEQLNANLATIGGTRRMISSGASTFDLPAFNALVEKSEILLEKIEVEIGSRVVSVYSATPGLLASVPVIWLTDEFSMNGVAKMANSPSGIDIDPLAFGNVYDDDPDDVRLPFRIEYAVGDWFLGRLAGGELVRERVVRVEKMDDDTIVHFVSENVTPDGKVIDSEEMSFSLLDRMADNMQFDLLLRQRGKKEKTTVEIGGKTVEAVLHSAGGDETWYSGAAAIQGYVKFILKDREGNVVFSLEPIDFGTAADG